MNTLAKRFWLTAMLSLTIFAIKSGATEASEGLTARVAAAIVEFDYKDIPPEVVSLTETLVRDSLAVAIGAHDLDTLADMEKAWDVNGGDYLLLYSGNKASLLEAVYLNSLASNLLDFDDAHTALGHPGATIVQPTLLLAQKYGSSREEVIEAVVAGYEFGIRWSAAAFAYPDRFAGPWSLGNVQAFGALVAAVKIMGLNPEQITRAFYLGAANMPIPTNQKNGLVPTQVLNGLKNNYGHTSQGMVLAAMSAEAGVVAEPTVLDGDQGLWRMTGATEFYPEQLLKDLGSRWDILEMQLKPYASCRWSHSALDAVFELRSRFDANDVKQIDVYSFDFAVNALSGTEPKTLAEMQFSIPHVLAMAMLDRSLIYMESANASDPEVVAYSKKVNIHLDQKYQQLFATGKLPSKVVVTLNDGTTFEKEVLIMKGETENPLSAIEHANKVKVLLDSTPHTNVREYADKTLKMISG